MPRIRVLVADDHAVLRAGLRMLIDAQSDMKVVGEAADGPETVSRARSLECDVVLLDLSMPGPKGAAIIERLARLDPSPRILVLTMHEDPAYLRAALQAGASGYIVKKAADVELLRALRVVHRGGTFVNLTRPDEEALGREVRRASREPPGVERARRLSPREAAVLRVLVQGHTYREAADRLGVSVKTIETYRKRLSDKLGLKTRAELFRFAVEADLLEGAAAARPEDK